MSYSSELSLRGDTTGFLPPTVPSAVLAPLCDGIRSLNARVAEEFMALAEVLQSNSMRAREITAESHKATGSEANLRTSHSMGMLQRILTDSAGMSAMVEVSTGKMVDILAHVKTARSPLKRLTKMRSLLQTVGVLSRIEGARITNTEVDLSSLSKDIDILAGQVELHVNGVFNDSSSLSQVLLEGVQELNDCQSQERTQVADLIQRTQAVLGPMIARSEASRVAAHDIDEQYASFHGSTGKVVMSLQSEDIARQRVEHVSEAIDRVAALLDSGDSMQNSAGVLAVQRAQLVSTRDLLAASVSSILDGLQSLSPRIRELVSRTETLAHQTAEDGESFASVIDGELAKVSAVFNQCSGTAKSVLAIVDSVLPSVEQMIKGASALEEIESSIHLISLNATVKTAHLGEEGVAMGVIASRLCSIAMTSEGDTKLVLDALATISGALTEITSQEAISESSLMMTGTSDVVSRELSGLSESVRVCNQEMTAGLTQVLEMAEGLCLQLERGCELAVRAASITDCFDEQLSAFDEVLEGLGYTKDLVAESVKGNQTESLSQLYSMESERKLHVEVFGSGDAESSMPPPESVQGSEFGDDVELF